MAAIRNIDVPIKSYGYNRYRQDQSTKFGTENLWGMRFKSRRGTTQNNSRGTTHEVFKVATTGNVRIYDVPRNSRVGL